jgi:hypothetical protein
MRLHRAVLLAALLSGCHDGPGIAPEPALVPISSAAGPVASIVAPTASTASASAAPSAAPRDLPFGASSAAPGDDALSDNPGCTRRKNSGVLAACAKHTGNLGGWAPTPDEMAAAMKLAGSICYCAGEMHAQARTCATRVKASTISMTVGRLRDPTDCTIAISAVSANGRRWIVIDATNRDVATFYGILSVVEQGAAGLTLYYQGFNGVPSDAEVAAGAQGVSPEMKRDWPTLPQDVRAALAGKAP